MLLNTPRVSKSGRITLSAPTAADDEAAAALRKDPITRRFLRFLPKDVTAVDMRNQRAVWAADPTVMFANVHALHRKRAPEYIGYVYLHHIDRVMSNSCQVGIAVRADRFGAGLAREAMYEVVRYAFEEMNIHRVVLRTAVNNELVWRWLDRLDVKFEMIERGCWSDGEGGYSDARMYSILHPEWVGGCRARVEQSMEKPQLEVQARL